MSAENTRTHATDPSSTTGSTTRSMADLERALKARDGLRALPKGTTREMLERILVHKRWDLLRLVCSDPWFRHCWETGEHFPPKAETTPMRPCRCPRCTFLGRLWPAYYDATSPASPDGVGTAGRGRPPGRASAAESVGAVESGRAGGAPTPDAGQAHDSILSYECYLESLDDWAAAQLPSSPSGLALRAIRERRIRLRFPKTKTRRR